MTEADADAQALPYVSSPSEFGSTSRDSSDPSSLSPPSSGSSSSGLPASARLRPPPIPLPLARSTPHSKARSERDGVRAAQCSDGGGVDESDEKGVLSELTVALMARREACERTLSSALDSRKTTGKKRKAEADSSLEHCVRLEQRLHTAQSEPHHFHLPGGRGFLPPTPAFLHLGVRTTDATCDAFTQIYHGTCRPFPLFLILEVAVSFSGFANAVNIRTFVIRRASS